MSYGTTVEAQSKLTADTWLLARTNRLFRIGIEGSWDLRGAPVLKNYRQQGTIPFGVATHACVEGEVGEETLAQQSGFVRRNSITDLGIDLGSRALERSEIIEVGHRSRILRPGQELLAGDNPN